MMSSWAVRFSDLTSVKNKGDIPLPVMHSSCPAPGLPISSTIHPHTRNTNFTTRQNTSNQMKIIIRNPAQL